MKKPLAEQHVDLARLPPLTVEQEGELRALAALPETNIDAGDLPSLPETRWREAAQGLFHKPTKTSTTLRIDSDVLSWLRSQGEGYQNRINAILRRAMLEEREAR